MSVAVTASLRRQRYTTDIRFPRLWEGGATMSSAKLQDSVAVVDEHDAVHAAIALWCSETKPAIRVSGNYFSAEQFLAKHPCGDGSGVGAVIFDLELQSRRVDFRALDRLVEPGHRVIVYSKFATYEVILTCLDRGATTYLMKSEGKDHLLEAIRAAKTDTPYIGPRMASAIFNHRTVGRPNLAPREKQVLIEWFRAESHDLVGRRLGIASTTVRTHIARVRTKYAAAGRPADTKAALVARAIQDGHISIDDL
jgi:DNA-binding NarL/FixJ family response regulator